MKYITTKENRIFKEGLKIQTDEDDPAYRVQYYTGSSSLYLGSKILERWIKKGYIKEVEEPEFTKSDMIDFNYEFGLTKTKIAVKLDFELWLKQRK